MTNSKLAEKYSLMPKQPFSFRFTVAVINEMKKLAKKENRTLSNYIENLMINKIEESKKKK